MRCDYRLETWPPDNPVGFEIFLIAKTDKWAAISLLRQADAGYLYSETLSFEDFFFASDMLGGFDRVDRSDNTLLLSSWKSENQGHRQYSGLDWIIDRLEGTARKSNTTDASVTFNGYTRMSDCVALEKQQVQEALNEYNQSLLEAKQPVIESRRF